MGTRQSFIEPPSDLDIVEMDMDDSSMDEDDIAFPGFQGLRSRNDRMMRIDTDSEDDDDDDINIDQFEHAPDEHDLATLLQILVRRGQIELINLEGRYRRNLLYNTIDPPKKNSAKTDILDKSEVSLSTKKACNLKIDDPINTHCNVLELVRKREYGQLSSLQNFSKPIRCQIANTYLPNIMHIIDLNSSKFFCGTYSKDGTKFLAACQRSELQLYDTSYKNYKLIKKIHAEDVGWSIIDTAFSPCGEYALYSTWSNMLHVYKLDSDFESHIELRLHPQQRRRPNFCMFSVSYSKDGKEILGAGSDDNIYIYNMTANQQTHKFGAHDGEINAVTFADESSQILYSGSDDCFCKVWDRRCLNEASPQPVGVLAGHRDGITFIDSRNDGKHFLSNSKDQTIKLWDIRVLSSEAAQEAARSAAKDRAWDYRWQPIPSGLFKNENIPGDTSVMTYRGHTVQKTLIRSRFSPQHTTGQRYIYSGCSLGRVVIYDILTGQIVKKLEGHKAVVRDVAWHPYRPEIVSCGWDCALGLWKYHKVTDDPMEPYDDENEEEEVVPRQRLRRSMRLAERRRREQNN